MKVGDLIMLSGYVAIIVDIDDTDVHFIYINRHIEGTQRLERWRISKKLTEMNIVSAV